MGLSGGERDRIRRIVGSIYTEGYTEGLLQAGAEYDIRDLIPDAAVRMSGPLKERLSLVDQAVDKYIEMLERKATQIQSRPGISSAEAFAELSRYAQNLADDRSQLITEMEFAEARLDGAGHMLDEAGIAYEWQFPHFDLGRPGHEECNICEAIRDGGPYTIEEAEAEGYPSFPHPG